MTIAHVALYAAVLTSAAGSIGAAEEPGPAVSPDGKALAPVSFPVDLGSIPAGATVTLEFDVQVSNPLTSFPAVSVSNQGTVSGTGVPAVATDDPATGTVGDPTVTPLDTADLVLTKGDSPDPVVAGSPLTYTLTVLNNGPSAAENVVVTDTLPPGVTFVSTTGCAEDPAGVPACSLGTIPAAGSVGFTINVTVDPDTTGALVNNAVVSSTTAEAAPGNEMASTTTTVVTEADLSITKTDDIDPVNAGSALIYTIEVTNVGPSAATNVVITDTLPAGVSFVASSGCAEDPSGVPTCSLGTIAAGGSTQATIEVSVDGATVGTITNTASVASDATDPVPGNNSTSEDTLVLAVASLDLTVAGSVDSVTAGETLTYTVDVDNLGPGDAQDVTVFNVLADETSYVSDTLGSCSQPGDLGGFFAELDGSNELPPVTTSTTGVATFAVDTTTGELWFALHLEGLVAPNEVVGAHIHSGAAGVNGPVVHTLYAGTPPVFDPANPIVGSIQLSPAELADLMANPHYVNVHTIDNPAGEVRGQMVLTAQVPVRCAVGTIAGSANSLFDIEVGVLADVPPTIEFDNLSMVFSSTGDPDEVALPAPNGTGLLRGATAGVSTVVTTAADLAISKTDSVDPVVAGTALTYTVQADNNGPSDAVDVVVTDTLPPGVIFVSTTGCAEDPGGVPGCSLGTIAAGNSRSYSIDVMIDPATAGTLTNAAAVTSSTPEANPGDESTTEDTAVVAQSDLSITKTDDIDPVNAGSALIYTIEVTNVGPSAATNVVITDTLPAGVSFVASSGCAEDPSGVPTCSLGTIAAGGSTQATIEVSVDGATVGTITNTASVASDATDPVPGNNSTSEDTLVLAVASLDLTVAGSVDSVTAGETLTYTVDVDNLGPGDAQDVTVFNVLADETSYVSDTLGSCSQPGDLGGFFAELDGSNELPPVTTSTTGVATFAVDTTTGELWFALHLEGLVAPNEVVGAHIHSGAAGVNGPVVHTLYAGTPPVFDPANPIVGSIQLSPAELADLMANPHYVNVHTIDNPAGEVRGQMVLTAQVPVRCAVGTIAGSANSLFDIEVGVLADVPPTIEFDNLSMVFSSTGDPDEVALPAPNGTGVLRGATFLVTTAVTTAADLVISKTDSVDPVVAGTALTYTVRVDNNGPSDATDVVATDTLPAGVTFVATTGCAEDPGGVPTCSLGTIPAGGFETYTIDVMVDAGTGGIISNTASVTSITPEANPGDESTTEETTVMAVADLSITKADTIDPVMAGTNLGYAIVVSNTGPSNDPATVTVTDTLPAGVSFVSAGGPGWTCGSGGGIVTCTRPGLAIFEAIAIDLVVAVDPTTRGILTNTATVSSPTTDPNPGNDQTSATTTVTAETDLSLFKNDSADPLPPGDPLVYTLTVMNNGPSSATDVTVTDTLPAGVTVVSTTGCAEDPSAVPVCTLGSINAGASAQYTITVTIDPGPPPAITNTATVTGLEPDPDLTNNDDSEETTLDAEPPMVTVLSTIGDTGDGRLDECETATVPIGAFLWSFSEEIYDPPGDTDPDDVTNPGNFRVLAPGGDFNFATQMCGPVLGDDVALTIPLVSYDPGTGTAAVSMGGQLPPSLYRVMACGSTSIVDLAGNPLDGTGNGVGGDDHVLTFRADPGNAFDNGHFDCDMVDWTPTSATPGEITHSLDDVDNSDLSGSVEITNLALNTDFALSQCVPVRVGLDLPLTGRMRFAAGPFVAVSISRECVFFAAGACAGGDIGSQVVTVLAGDTGGAWVPFAGVVVPPVGAVTANCSFRISNPTGADFTAWFDQLYLDDGSHIFSDGFESGDTSAWSAAQGE